MEIYQLNNLSEGDFSSEGCYLDRVGCVPMKTVFAPLMVLNESLMLHSFITFSFSLLISKIQLRNMGTQMRLLDF